MYLSTRGENRRKVLLRGLSVKNDVRVKLDVRGFMKTGRELVPDDFAASNWLLGRDSNLLETSLPGVFAVGDVRGGNFKRVASAVREGSIAVSSVHCVLHD